MDRTTHASAFTLAALDYTTTSGFSDGTLPAGITGLPSEVADDGRRFFWLQGSGCAASSVKVLTYDRKLGVLPEDTSPSPVGFGSTGAIAWSGTELLAWSEGACGTPLGARFQPAAPAP